MPRSAVARKMSITSYDRAGRPMRRPRRSVTRWMPESGRVISSCDSSTHDRPITRVGAWRARAQMAGTLPPWRSELRSV